MRGDSATIRRGRPRSWGARGWGARALAVGLTLAVAVGGCGPAGRDRGDVDALHALPYVDFAAGGAAERTGVLRWDRDRAAPGYSLYVSSKLCRADLIDLAGRSVHHWVVESCRHWAHAELLENGDLIVVGTHPVPEKHDRSTMVGASYLIRLSWEGEVVWKTPAIGHHDCQPTPNGEIVSLTNSWRRVPHIDRRHDLRDQGLLLIAPSGSPRRELSLFDVIERSPEILELQPTAPRHRHGGTRSTCSTSIRWSGCAGPSWRLAARSTISITCS